MQFREKEKKNLLKNNFVIIDRFDLAVVMSDDKFEL